MSGTIRFDDEHIVKFTLDEENHTLEVEVILNGAVYTETVTLGISQEGRLCHLTKVILPSMAQLGM